MVPSSDIRNEVYQHLRKIFQALSIHSKQLNKRFGLTGPQLMLLKAIASQAHPTIGNLAQSVSLSQATVTSILDRLENRGLVQRTRSEVDKRRVLVTLTDSANAILAENPTIFQEDFSRRFDKLPEWQQQMILSSLELTSSLMETDKIPVDPAIAESF
ncbi:MarR family winged helix-turn-helix transcriptional regulator [Spirochaeta africana]|uniref:Transcriptional regulator n=1 Tax=Spirochaeta africana (strain ATCC 700263 / DSM 8902 / Z-7692) TaxID=889378 RepID=H9UIA2_SPIAZ|nr:MarR family transcriptional regulator [Spirochaeta africana]AFG37245.1 transcriptional regulator [Spirochaeta africana DSM 8902]